jgi:hypothetical protein
MIPEALRIYWDSQCYIRGEGERAGSLGALYLTNIQQFYERAEGPSEEPDIMTAVMGPKPPSRKLEVEDFGKRMTTRGEPIMALNDEAHHTHDEDSEWNHTVRRVNDDTSAVNCIVSVLMLREGWDVQNVTVIVGLRPYTSKANILPEQTVGRGLRLMFRNQGTGYTERVDVIGNKAFIEFVEQLEREEELQLETFEIGKDKVVIDEQQPQLLHEGHWLSETPPFPWSRPTLNARKCVFNLVPCDNEFERAFAAFLQHARDVRRFGKLSQQFGFVLSDLATTSKAGA